MNGMFVLQGEARAYSRALRLLPDVVREVESHINGKKER